MKTETTQIATIETTFIADECGDTLWDEVLQQPIHICSVNTDPNNTNSWEQHVVSEQTACISQK